MSLKSLKTIVASAAVLFLAQAAGAHPWPNHAQGFASGLQHPLTGVDHILAMIAVGICAARIGGRAIWALPTLFLSTMLIGGFIGIGHPDVPFIEHGIAASVLILGLLVAADSPVPLLLISALVALFALFHGYAHGTELQPGLAPATFAAGFLLATALLLAVGITIGCLLMRTSAGPLRRLVGVAVSLCGVALLFF